MIHFIFQLFVSVSAFAGVGGASGGSIFFQEHSTWVEPTAPSLCVQDDMFRARMTTCQKWTGREQSNCAKKKDIFIYQPIESEIEKCRLEKGRGGWCADPQIVPFYQSPVRVIDIFDRRGEHVIEQVEIEVKRCR